MQTGSGAPGSVAVPESGALAIVAALASERRTLSGIRPVAGDWFVSQSGPGPAAARAAAVAAVRRGASSLMSWGLAGGLTADVAAGTVVLPDRLVEAGREPVPTATAWRDRLAAALPTTLDVSRGALACVTSPLTHASDKSRLAATLDAVAVDMESRAIAEIAVEFDLPFVAVRIVLDRCDDELPGDIASFVTSGGNVRIHRALLSALSSARNRRMLRVLARRSAVAHDVLRQVAASLAASDFGRVRDGLRVSA